MKTSRSFAYLGMVWMALCAIPCFAQPSANVSANEKAVRQFFTAYETKDWHLLEQIFADGFTFSSPAGENHIDQAEYKRLCWPNCQNFKKVDLEEVVVTENDAFVTYNGWTNDGRFFRNTERFKVNNGKITEEECFFGPGVNFPNNQAKK